MSSLEQLPSSIIVSSVTDTSAVLQCLGALAKAIRIGLPPLLLTSHRSWDTINDYGLRITVISQLCTIDALLGRILSGCCKGRATKCELLRWIAMLLPPWHPSYRIVATMFSSDPDSSVALLAKQLFERKPTILPDRESMMKKVAVVFSLDSWHDVRLVTKDTVGSVVASVSGIYNALVAEKDCPNV